MSSWTSLTLGPGCYRFRLFLDFWHGLVVPSLSLTLLLKISNTHLPLPLLISCHICCIVAWAFTRIALRRRRQSIERKQLIAREIPRVIGKWPGNIDILLRMMKAFKTSYILDVYLQLFEEYQCTTLNLRILWVDTIITMDHEHMKFVTSTGFHSFWRGPNQKERLETFLGKGIFNRDDEIWKMHRTSARPFFAKERISDFDIFEKNWLRTLSIISSRESSRQATDSQDLYGRFTLDAAAEFLFGTNLNTLSASLPIPGVSRMGPKGSATADDGDAWGSFVHAFESAQTVATTRARLGYFWPVLELFGDRNKGHVERIHRWLEPLVSRALEERDSAKKVGLEKQDETFLQHLADSTDDPILIRDQLLNMLLASRDTTACLLTFVTYFMALHPEVTQRLRAEVLEHCGSTSPPTYEQIRKLRYMRATINETLRLFPPVPLNVRESRPNASCVLPPSDPTYQSRSLDPQQQRPCYMPSNTLIMYFPLLMQRNPALWGRDADVFDPDRWIDPDRLAKFVSNPTVFTPFSAGPRICIGQNYAYNEASYFLVRLLQSFDTFTLASECQPEGSLPPKEWRTRKGRQSVERIWPSAALTLYIKGGLWVRFGRSSSSGL